MVVGAAVDAHRSLACSRAHAGDPRDGDAREAHRHRRERGVGGHITAARGRRTARDTPGAGVGEAGVALLEPGGHHRLLERARELERVDADVLARRVGVVPPYLHFMVAARKRARLPHLLLVGHGRCRQVDVLGGAPVHRHPGAAQSGALGGDPGQRGADEVHCDRGAAGVGPLVAAVGGPGGGEGRPGAPIPEMRVGLLHPTRPAQHAGHRHRVDGDELARGVAGVPDDLHDVRATCDRARGPHGLLIRSGGGGQVHRLLEGPVHVHIGRAGGGALHGYPIQLRAGEGDAHPGARLAGPRVRPLIGRGLDVVLPGAGVRDAGRGLVVPVE